jgi:hypothetical protein
LKFDELQIKTTGGMHHGSVDLCKLQSFKDRDAVKETGDNSAHCGMHACSAFVNEHVAKLAFRVRTCRAREADLIHDGAADGAWAEDPGSMIAATFLHAAHQPT